MFPIFSDPQNIILSYDQLSPHLTFRTEMKDHRYSVEMIQVQKDASMFCNNNIMITKGNKWNVLFTKYMVRPSNWNWVLIESLVKPASGPTRTLSSCNNVFSSVDFPTLGRPTMASCNGNLLSPFSSVSKVISSCCCSGIKPKPMKKIKKRLDFSRKSKNPELCTQIGTLRCLDQLRHIKQHIQVDIKINMKIHHWHLLSHTWKDGYLAESSLENAPRINRTKLWPKLNLRSTLYILLLTGRRMLWHEGSIMLPRGQVDE